MEALGKSRESTYFQLNKGDGLASESVSGCQLKCVVNSQRGGRFKRRWGYRYR